MSGARRRGALLAGAVILLAALYLVQGLITALQEKSPTGRPPLPTVESAAQLVLVGFRAVVVDVFWMQASDLQEEGQIDEAVAKYDKITKLQPDLADVWHYLSWNSMYNLPYELEAVEDKWNVIKLGVEYTDMAAQRVPDNGFFDKDIGFMLWHRFDDRTFPQAAYLRRKFREWKGKTNFEVAIEWMEKAVKSEEFKTLGEGSKDIWRRQIGYTLDRWTIQAFVDGELDTALRVAKLAVEKWEWISRFNKGDDPGININFDRLADAKKRLAAIKSFIASKEAAKQKTLDKASRLAAKSVDIWQSVVDVWPSGPDLPALQTATAWLERLNADKKAEKSEP
ncbi:MAG: hypothetical protein GXP25_08820 [Planctomycetes bacterium]|nr:hypothetical protein [Planctomycetota bacterium]